MWDQNETVAYIGDIILTEYDYDKWFDRMPGFRKEKIQRFRFDEDKKRGVLGWILICKALEETAGFSYEYVAENVYADHRGKLYLNDKVYFNIAHAGDKVICAASGSEVGCDVEKKNCDGLKIAKRFFSEKEYKYLESISDKADQEREFLKLWTMKEAFVKTVGDGLSFPIDKICFIDDNRKILSAISPDDKGTFYFKAYDAGEGYSCCVCSRNDAFSEDIKLVLEA